MAIPRPQIDTWSNQGAKVSSDATYNSVVTALTRSGSPIAPMISAGTITIGLQGSYAHDTNIYGDSDVDIIVKHKNTFHSNKHELPSDQRELHDLHYPDASYSWADLRRDVITALGEYYGSGNVDTTGNKSLKIAPVSGRLRADVVPVISYREYGYFLGPNNHSKAEGVAFHHASTGARIVNYPDQHHANSTAKHRATNYRYKELVRILKNMRSSLVDKGRLTKEEAPSYFVQGMVYNIPTELFVAERADMTFQALYWLARANPDVFISQNGQHLLLGNSGEYWNPDSARKTIAELCNLWDKWGNI